MSVAVEKEQVVAGFINTNKDGIEFTLDDIYNYIETLWNAGCGPIILNFTRSEMQYFLDRCRGIVLSSDRYFNKWKIDKSVLSEHMTPEEGKFLHNNKELAKSFDLFCKLQVDLRTPSGLLDAMGYRFIYKEPLI